MCWEVVLTLPFVVRALENYVFSVVCCILAPVVYESEKVIMHSCLFILKHHFFCMQHFPLCLCVLMSGGS